VAELSASYPQKSFDSEDEARAWSRKVRLLLLEYPASIVSLVADPRIGVVAKARWLPSPAEVREFCERLLGQKAEALAWEQAKAAPPPEPQDPEDERERNADMLRQLSHSIREAAKATQRANSKLEVRQVHDPKVLLDSLDNLDEMRTGKA
jgi:hypothetical protein